MESPLHIPGNKKYRGLTVFCNKCKRDISNTCGENGKSLVTCINGDKHVFKLYLHTEGTRNSRKTKAFKTRDVNEAIKQAIEFEKQVKEKVDLDHISKIPKPLESAVAVEIPVLLVNALARYIGWLNNEGVPVHRRKQRSEEHIKDVERAFESLVFALKKGGYNVSKIAIDSIDDKMVGEIYNYLITEKNFSNRSFNKYFGYYTSFLKWFCEEYNVPIRNWFEKVNRKKTNSNPQSISKEEFMSLLKMITPENGIKEYSSGKKTKRNLYRPWLKNGLRLAIETGRRREEIVNLKFNNIISDTDGNSFISVEDFKVNRIQNRITEEEKKYIYIPITKSLEQLLVELNFKENQGKDIYILAPEITINRKDMCDVLSRGFSHYYSQLSSDKKLSFKSLRKTYITNLSIFMGGNAKAITQHSDDAVIERHYLDKQALAKAAKGFQVFSDEPERKRELAQTRNSKKIATEVELGK